MREPTPVGGEVEPQETNLATCQHCGAVALRGAAEPEYAGGVGRAATGDPGHEQDLPPPGGVPEMTDPDAGVRLVVRNGRLYAAKPVVPISPKEQIEQIIAGLKKAMPTDEQKEAVEKYVRPSLERYGVQ